MTQRNEMVESLRSMVPFTIRVNSVDFPYMDALGQMKDCIDKEYQAVAISAANYPLYNGIVITFYDPKYQRRWWVPIELITILSFELDKRSKNKKLNRSW